MMLFACPPLPWKSMYIYIIHSLGTFAIYHLLRYSVVSYPSQNKIIIKIHKEMHSSWENISFSIRMSPIVIDCSGVQIP